MDTIESCRSTVANRRAAGSFSAYAVACRSYYWAVHLQLIDHTYLQYEVLGSSSMLNSWNPSATEGAEARDQCGSPS